jgi:plastocyanin
MLQYLGGGRQINQATQDTVASKEKTIMKTTLKTTLALAIITRPPRLCSQILLCALGVGIFALASSRAVTAATFTVEVAPPVGAPTFSPFAVFIQPGDTVMWVWKDTPDGFHGVTSGTPTGGPTGLFDSGIHNKPFTFFFTFPNPGTFNYYCVPHGLCCGMVGRVIVAGGTPTPTPTPTPAGPSQPLNISTRMDVQTGEQVLIGGFIVTGNAPKKIILRAIGPSLAAFGISNPLADPVLELHGADGSLITSNDNWKDTQQPEIEASGIPPQNDLESAIVTTLAPDSYTAIVSGKDGATGVGLVEGYDLDQAADSQLANISTRGFVETGSNVMIGGFIIGGGGGGDSTIVVRGIGPSLTALGVTGALEDPTLELHDGSGAIIASNDNWIDSPDKHTIIDDGLAPSNDKESALLATLAPGAYTAIVRGVNNTTGVALVEAYNLQ